MHTHVQLRICSQRNHQVCQGCSDRECELRAEQFKFQFHPKSELNPDAGGASSFAVIDAKFFKCCAMCDGRRY